MTTDELAWLKSASAAVCQRDARGRVVVLGSAYLIAPDRLGTCEHVVTDDEGEAASDLFAWLPGEGEIPITVEALDRPADAAVLRLARAVKARPLDVRPSSPQNGDAWTAYGYPELLNDDPTAGISDEPAPESAGGSTNVWCPIGKTLTGTVTDAHAKDTTRAASLDLESSAIAAGQGARPHGFSGSPVTVGKRLVGHLKRIVENDDARAELGALYACPATVVARLAGLGNRSPAWTPRMPDAPYDRSFYVHHADNEERALTRLEWPGTPVVLWGPTGSGKTYLLRYLLDELDRRDQEQGRTSLVLDLDLDPVVQPGGTMEDLVAALVNEIVDSAGGPRTWADDVLRLPRVPLKKLEELLSRYVLTGPQDLVYLVLERADAVWSRFPLAQSAQFYSWLRGISQKATPAKWGKLRMIMAMSTTPALLIRDEKAGSPWPPTDVIRLDGFTIEQAAAMADLHRLSWDRGVLANMLDYVGAYPWILRRIMYAASAPRSRFQPVAAGARAADRASILEHFRPTLLEDLKKIEDDDTLREALSAVITSDAPEVAADALIRLQQAGIVGEAAGKVFIQSKLYEDFLRERWKLPARK